MPQKARLSVGGFFSDWAVEAMEQVEMGIYLNSVRLQCIVFRCAAKSGSIFLECMAEGRSLSVG